MQADARTSERRLERKLIVREFERVEVRQDFDALRENVKDPIGLRHSGKILDVTFERVFFFEIPARCTRRRIREVLVHLANP